MKTITISIFALLLFSCGSSPIPFSYQDNSRFIVEAVLVNENNAILSNQIVKVYSRNGVFVKASVSDGSGVYFLSIPNSNFGYVITFEGKTILSMQQNQQLIYVNPQTNENSGKLTNLDNTYYDLGVVALKNE